MAAGNHCLNDYELMLRGKGLVTASFIPGKQGGREVAFISYDTREMEPGTLFVCKGAHFKDEYLAAALKGGAFAYIAEKKHEEAGDDVPYIIVNDMRKTLAVMADYYYDSAWSKIKTIGITGTKGKSTTTFFMKQILDDFEEANGRPETAVVSGIDNYDGAVREESRRTTPEAFELWQHFSNAVESGIGYLTMEVSSQALKYDRTYGINFDIGCFMNIGEDHISPIEHPTLEDYIESKMILFRQCKTAVINKDSKYAKMALSAAEASDVTERILTFGENGDADIVGYDVRPGRDGVTFRAKRDDAENGFDEEFTLGLPGTFNVSNALAAITISYALGIPVEYMKSGLRKARVAGRMEVFRNRSNDLAVIVDYAHNQMSFQALFDSTAKEYPGWTVNIVFGCPGKKALGRRKTLGEIAGKCAALTYITEEDEGEEPVEVISKEVAGNVAAAGGKYVIINDREKAIHTAIMDAGPETVILITGKGRETRQKRGMKYIDTPSDVDYTERFIREKDGKQAD